MSGTQAAVRNAAMSERALQDAIIDAARSLNYLVYHCQDSRRNEPGFPDLIIAGHGVLIAWELKTAKGKLRPPSVTKAGRYLPGQQEWLDAINYAAPVLAGVVRPDDLDDALWLLNDYYERDRRIA